MNYKILFFIAVTSFNIFSMEQDNFDTTKHQAMFKSSSDNNIPKRSSYERKQIYTSRRSSSENCIAKPQPYIISSPEKTTLKQKLVTAKNKLLNKNQDKRSSLKDKYKITHAISAPELPGIKEFREILHEIGSQETIMETEKMDLLKAIQDNDSDKVEVLLYGKESIDINLQNSETGNTPLIEAVINLNSHYAEYKNAKKIINTLLMKGISVGDYGDRNIVEAIDLEMRNFDGKSAMDIIDPSLKDLLIRMRQLKMINNK